MGAVGRSGGGGGGAQPAPSVQRHGGHGGSSQRCKATILLRLWLSSSGGGGQGVELRGLEHRSSRRRQQRWRRRGSLGKLRVDKGGSSARRLELPLLLPGLLWRGRLPRRLGLRRRISERPPTAGWRRHGSKSPIGYNCGVSAAEWGNVQRHWYLLLKLLLLLLLLPCRRWGIGLQLRRRRIPQLLLLLLLQKLVQLKHACFLHSRLGASRQPRRLLLHRQPGGLHAIGATLALCSFRWPLLPSGHHRLAAALRWRLVTG